MSTSDHPPLDASRRLVHRLLDGEGPRGTEFDACRAVVRADPASESGFQALCMLLEGTLADPRLAIDDTQIVVPLLKALARGDVSPDDFT